MTKLNIDRVGESKPMYAIDYAADGVEIGDVREIMELITDLYERQGSFKQGEEFVVSKVEFHGHFKIRE